MDRTRPSLLVSAAVTALLVAGCGATASTATRVPVSTSTPASSAVAMPTTAATPTPAGTPTTRPGASSALTGWQADRTLDAPGTGSFLFAGGLLWAVDRKDAGFTGNLPNGEINLIDSATGRIVRTIEHARGGFPAAGLGSVWLVNAEFGETVTRVHLDTYEVERFRTSTTAEPVPEAIVIAGGYAWVGNNHDGTVAQVDPATNTVVKTIRLTDEGAFGVRGKAATDGTSVWFGISRTGEIVRIDAATATEVSRVRLPLVAHAQLPKGMASSEASVPEQLVFAGGRLYASTVDHTYGIDVDTVGEERIVADIPTGMNAATLVAGPADASGRSPDVWALLHDPMELVRIDGATSSVMGRVPVALDDAPLEELAVGAGAVWIRTPGHVTEFRPSGGS